LSDETKEQVDYFDGLEGEGLDGLTGAALATAYLSMIQPGSTATLNGAKPGTWRNSATDDNYGPTVKVIPLAFKTVWTERDAVPPYATINRYEPNSIEVKVVRPKAGQRGFPKMFNPETNNQIQELFIYAVLLEDYPEQGILYFSPTVSSMKTCKTWNSQLRSQRLPNGRSAPIFAFSWELTLDLVQNPVKPADLLTKFVSVRRGNIVDKDLFFNSVQPQLSAAANVAMLAAPEISGDAEPDSTE
jgi:hypothetical protein